MRGIRKVLIGLIGCIANTAFTTSVSADAGVFADPSLIVTCNLTNNQPGGQMFRYRASDGQFVDRLAGITTPRGVAQGPDGALYVCSVNDNSLLRYNPITGA